MRPLRLIAIASNVAFIAYAISADMRPILILQSVLLPVNVSRLAQLKIEWFRQRRPVTAAVIPDAVSLSSGGAEGARDQWGISQRGADARQGNPSPEYPTAALALKLSEPLPTLRHRGSFADSGNTLLTP